MAEALRNPTKSELEYFRQNPTVSGMATEDDRVILNPFSNLNESQQQAVYLNELTRLFLRKRGTPQFDVTDQQAEAFSGYGTEEDIRATILGRIVSGDPSALSTPTQRKIASDIFSQMSRK